MDDYKFIRIDTKLDEVNNRLTSIDQTLAAQHVSLKDHIRRTEILEETVKPIQEHVLKVNGVLTFFKYLASIAVIAEVVRLFIK